MQESILESSDRASARAVSDTWECRLTVSSSDGCGRAEESQVDFTFQLPMTWDKMRLGQDICAGNPADLRNWQRTWGVCVVYAVFFKTQPSWASTSGPEVLNECILCVECLAKAELSDLCCWQPLVTVVAADPRVRSVVLSGVEVFYAADKPNHSAPTGFFSYLSNLRIKRHTSVMHQN